MKELPILFSTIMVEANLDDRKTMTRRIVKPQPIWNVEQDGNLYEGNHKGYVKVDGHSNWAHQFAHEFSKWKAGDILWVREKWHATERKDQGVGNQFIIFEDEWEENEPKEIAPLRPVEKFYRWGCHPSIHLPKYAARIWQQVIDVRAERLRDITEEDAKAEGVKPAHCESNKGCPSQLCKEGCAAIGEWWNYNEPKGEGFPAYSARESFETLWQSINGAESWKANPWVWVITYKILSTTGKPDLQNIQL